MKRRGLGLGAMMYGVGYGFARPDFGSAEVELADDGTLTIWNGASELGQGLRTILCQIAAQELGIAYEDTRIISADTATTPDGGPVSASRATYVHGNAVILACQDLKAQILATAAELLAVPAETLAFRAGGVEVEGDPAGRLTLRHLADVMHKRGNRFRGYGWKNITTADVDHETSQGDAYATYAWASQLVELEVDTDTGQVTVLRLVSATDAGKAINPRGVEGQIEGGAVQGLGFALTENMIVENGIFRNASLSTYLVPTAADVPPITPLIVEVHDPTGPYGAKGVGEPASIPTTPAVLNAIAAAIGHRVRRTPASPEHLLQVMGVLASPEKECLSLEDIPYPPD